MNRLKVQVVATSFGGTRAALLAARTLAAGLDARVVIFVPFVVPYGEALDHPTIKPAFIGDRFGRLAEEFSMEVDVQVCVCRSWLEALTSVLSRDGAVVVGGRSRRWWTTAEQRLAASLARAGFNALFVNNCRLSVTPKLHGEGAESARQQSARLQNAPENTKRTGIAIALADIESNRIQTEGEEIL